MLAAYLGKNRLNKTHLESKTKTFETETDESMVTPPIRPWPCERCIKVMRSCSKPLPAGISVIHDESVWLDSDVLYYCELVTVIGN